MKAIKASLAVVVWAVAWLLAGPAAHASLILTGPPLSGDIVAWDDAGLQFVALREITLNSFVFANQGQADVIWLTDGSGNVLEAHAVPSDDPSHFVEVDWPLQAGATYQLVADQPHNGRWADFRDFPISNEDLVIAGAVGNDALLKTYWFSFTHLTTTAIPVPEPGPWGLFSLVALHLSCRRRLR